MKFGDAVNFLGAADWRRRFRAGIEKDEAGAHSPGRQNAGLETKLTTRRPLAGLVFRRLRIAGQVVAGRARPLDISGCNQTAELPVQELA